MKLPSRLLLLLVLCCGGSLTANASDAPYRLADKALKLVPIDSTDKESFLSVNLDSEGRIFAGAREALFVYEPQEDGSYGERQELYRFPKDTWIYDVVIRGNDLYVMTVTALYLLPDARVKRKDVTVKPLLWGFPGGSIPRPTYGVHQGLHGLAWGPDGDLYFSFGDLGTGLGDFSRPDHWSFFYVYTADGKKLPFNGVGGIGRIKPDGTNFRIMADGLRNPCGLAFDSHWNLFTHDNDHESKPALYVPGRLLYATQGADFAWPRGWALFKAPQRRDLLKTMNDSMGRTVPVGQSFYDETYLPEEYRNNILLARWGQRTVERYTVTPSGATFRGEAKPLLVGTGRARPVGVGVGRGGRIFSAICYMGGNERSPVYRSDLVMITRADDTAAHPFESVNLVTAKMDSLLEYLASPSRELRHAAHVECLRRGDEKLFVEATNRLTQWHNSGADPAGRHDLNHLVHLAIASPNPAITKLLPMLLKHKSAAVRLQAMRAMYTAKQTDGLESLIDDPDLQVRHQAWIALTRLGTTAGHAPRPLELNDKMATAISQAAMSSDTYLRQYAVFMLAQYFDNDRLAKLCESPQTKERLAATMALGRRLTLPKSDFIPPKEMPLAPAYGHKIHLDHKVIDLDKIAHIGNYTMQTHWKHAPRSDEQEQLFKRLLEQTRDESEVVRLHAARYLAVLKDARSEPAIAKVWANTSSRRLAKAASVPIGKAWVLGAIAEDADGKSLQAQLISKPIDLRKKHQSKDDSLGWKTLESSDGTFSLPQGEPASYLYFQLQSSTRQTVNLSLHAPGKAINVMIWRNGQLMASASGHHSRGLIDTKNIAKMELHSGSNDILVRVNNTVGAPSLRLQLKAADKIALHLPSHESASLASRLAKATASDDSTRIAKEFLETDWSKAATEGDPKQGQKLFTSIGCAKCHAVSSEFPISGGPSLAGAGQRFSSDYLVESVLAPSRRISEMFQTITIVTTQGKMFTGLVLSSSDDQIKLLLADTERIVIKKKDIEEQRTSTTSVMPVGLVKTPAELRHLLAFLLQLKEES